MRYLAGFVFVLTLAVLPLSVSAQDGEEGATSEPIAEERSSEPAPEEPALQLQLDEAGVEGGLSPRLRKRTQRHWDPSAYDVRSDPRPRIQYTSAPQKPTRPKLAPGIGLGVSIASLVGGVAMMSVGVSQRFCISFGEPCDTPRSSGVLIGTGAALTVFGLLGTIVSGVAFRDSEGASAKAPSQRNARRVQWDPAQSRLVF